jgi:hypothetical protein
MRLTALESERESSTAPRPVEALAAGMRARINAVHVQEEDDSDSDDWEQAGAGAASASCGGKKVFRSGAARTARDEVVVKMDWPHLHVYRGAGKSAATYQDLTLPEFVFGFTSQLLKANLDMRVRELMLLHLQALMLDATRVSWPAVRHFHEIVVHQMEMANLTWSDTDKIQELRTMYARDTVANNAYANNMGRPVQQARVAETRYCAPFQTNSCRHATDHDSGRGPVRHVCAFCMGKGRGFFNHGEFECRRKKMEAPPSKNED